jgi:hypothetical protein
MDLAMVPAHDMAKVVEATGGLVDTHRLIPDRLRVSLGTRPLRELRDLEWGLLLLHHLQVIIRAVVPAAVIKEVTTITDSNGNPRNNMVAVSITDGVDKEMAGTVVTTREDETTGKQCSGCQSSEVAHTASVQSSFRL